MNNDDPVDDRKGFLCQLVVIHFQHGDKGCKLFCYVSDEDAIKAYSA